MHTNKDHKDTTYVIGAGGFIGTHLVKGLNCLGLSQSTKQDSKIIKVKNYWETIPPKPDFIIHVAEPSLIPNDPNFNEEKYQNDRLKLVKNLLDLNPKHFIYFSSALVNKRDTAYSRSKLAVENFLRDHKQSIIIRPANIYGLGMSSSNIISELITQINKGNNPILIKKANVSTSYLYISDLVVLIRRIIQNPKPGTYYAAGTQLISSLELTKIVIDIFGNNQELIAKDYDDLSSIECDTHYTNKAFNWYPEVDIRSGLKKLKKELVVFS